MSTSPILEKILNLSLEEAKVLYYSCYTSSVEELLQKSHMSEGNYNYHMGKVYEAFSDLEELQEADAKAKAQNKELHSSIKRRILLKAVDEEVEDLFKEVEIKTPKDFDDAWEDVVLNKKIELRQGKKETTFIDPKPEEHPPPPFWKLILIRARRLWNQIPEGLPRTLAPGIGLGVIVILFVWVLTECGGEPIPPTEEPPTEIAEVPPEEPTEVIQVVPPTDTEIPQPTAIPTETFTPTITYTPTSTPTPTITLTPTMTPTWVEPAGDNLPLVFEGEYDERVYAPVKMILNIDTKNGDNISGTILFPDSGRILGWEGLIVHSFDDVTEQAKWYFIEDFGSEGTYIKETRRWIIAGGGNLSGNFYYYISPTGDVTGVRYYFDRVTPEATIELYFNE